MTQRTPARIAVVGATGLVGRTMIQVLSERGHAPSELTLLASGRSAGGSVELPGGGSAVVREALPEAFDGIDIALFSAGAGVSRELAPQAVERGATVIDNSSAWRMDAGVPLVVQQVNPGDLEGHEGIIANPNCSTMQLVPLLMALRDTVGLERVIVDTYQSVSGTGADAGAALAGQLSAHAAGRPIEPAVDPHPIAFNALPEIDVFREDGYTQEEWKVVQESRKILHLPDLAISCTAVRVPVFVSHSEAVHVETTRPISPAEARSLFARVPDVEIRDDPQAHVYPLATEAAGTDDILVGRIRRDASLPEGRGLALWVVADNVRVGAASNAVRLAEVLIERGWLAPRSRRSDVRSAERAGGGRVPETVSR